MDLPRHLILQWVTLKGGRKDLRCNSWRLKFFQGLRCLSMDSIPIHLWVGIFRWDPYRAYRGPIWDHCSHTGPMWDHGPMWANVGSRVLYGSNVGSWILHGPNMGMLAGQYQLQSKEICDQGLEDTETLMGTNHCNIHKRICLPLLLTTFDLE